MIYMLVKVFQEEEYADALMRGQMYANSLAYFKNLESRGDGRADANEGDIVFPHESVFITLTPPHGETITITGDMLATSPILTPRWFDHINMYCMYAVRGDDLKDVPSDKLDEFKRQLEIPEDCNELGEHAVVVINTPEFFTRVRDAAEREGYLVGGDLVNYYDLESGTPSPEEDIDTIFNKREEYAYQSEYRIALNTRIEDGKPIILDIGDISDIAMRMNTADINRSFSVRA